MLDIPHVFMRCNPAAMLEEALRLRDLVVEAGIEFTSGMVRANYEPAGGIVVLSLMGVSDDVLRAAVPQSSEDT